MRCGLGVLFIARGGRFPRRQWIRTATAMDKNGELPCCGLQDVGAS
jgi:hypothetical protein